MRSIEVPILELRDPLAELLGALAPGETFRYAWADAVKLAGHSCPVVAGAYLMTRAALGALYPNETPERGQIEVTLGGAPDDAVLGPMSQVIAFVTGAAPQTGFGGLMGRHRRRDLLKFDPSLAGRIRFRRADTGATVELSYRPSGVPPAPEMSELMAATLGGRASAEQRARFGELWQNRVADILTGDPKRVLTIERTA